MEYITKNYKLFKQILKKNEFVLDVWEERVPPVLVCKTNLLLEFNGKYVKNNHIVVFESYDDNKSLNFVLTDELKDVYNKKTNKFDYIYTYPLNNDRVSTYAKIFDKFFVDLKTQHYDFEEQSDLFYQVCLLQFKLDNRFTKIPKEYQFTVWEDDINPDYMYHFDVLFDNLYKSKNFSSYTERIYNTGMIRETQGNKRGITFYKF